VFDSVELLRPRENQNQRTRSCPPCALVFSIAAGFIILIYVVIGLCRRGGLVLGVDGRVRVRP